MKKKLIKLVLGLFYEQRIRVCGGSQATVDWDTLALQAGLRVPEVKAITETWSMTAYNGLMRKA